MLTHTGDDKALFGVASSSYNISHSKRRGRSLIYGNNNEYGETIVLRKSILLLDLSSIVVGSILWICL